GVLAYFTGQSATDVTLTWVDRSGKVIETVGSPGNYRGVDLSPDGSRLAVHRHDGNGGDIWVFESSRGPMSRLTFDTASDNSSPIWSPDGTRLVFASLRNQKWGLYVKLANGSGGEERLLENDLLTAPMAWSPDGNSIVFRFVDSKTQGDQWLLPLNGDRKPTPLLQAPFNELRAQISPDGKWIAYDSNETGRPEIYVRPFPSGEGKRQVSANGGMAPRWRRDGKELFFMTPQSKMASVKINVAGSSLNYDAAMELFDSGTANLSLP